VEASPGDRASEAKSGDRETLRYERGSAPAEREAGIVSGLPRSGPRVQVVAYSRVIP